MTVAAVLAALAVPQALADLDRARGLAAARYLAARMALARARAVEQVATVAVTFDDTSGDVRFAMVIDGNGNGVRARDIDAGIDRYVEPPVRIGDLYQGVVIDAGGEATADDPVGIGRSRIVSFTPAGTATSGTVHVRGRDGTQWAVRILGATARARVLRYVPATGQWIDAF